MTGQEGTTRTPRFAEWVSTLACDLACPHCAACAGAPAGDELDTTEALALLDAFSELGVEHLCVSGGEPTLRADWQTNIARALDLFRGVHLITNGHLGERLLRIAESLPGHERLTVAVSLDGTRGAHDGRRGEGSFDRAVSILRASSSIEREVITTIARDNVGEVDVLADLCVSLGVRFWTLQPAVPLGRLARRDALGRDAVRVVVEARRRTEARLGDSLRVNTSCLVACAADLGGGEAACPGGRDQLVVMPDGRVVGCQLARQAAPGSVREHSLDEIWRSGVLVDGLGGSGCVAASRRLGG